MAVIHGSLTIFDSHVESWPIYIERLNQYFIANDVKDAAKKRAILLSACGPRTYKLIRNLTEEKPDRIEYADLVKLVETASDPKSSVIVQRFKFNSRNRGVDETVSTYVAALRQLAEHCNFTSLPEMLRDRLVCGVNHSGIQKRLLAEKDLTFDKALEMARAIEAAERGTKDLKSGDITATSPAAIQKQNLVSHASQQKRKRSSSKTVANSGRSEKSASELPNKPCYRCEGNHSPITCRCKDWECRLCKKKGHIAKVCRSSSKQPSRSHFLTQDIESVERYDPSFYTNGIPNPYNNTAGPVPIQPTNTVLKTYLGEAIPIKGTLNVSVRYKDLSGSVPLLVVSGSAPNLFGRDWLSQFNVNLGQVLQLDHPQSALNEALSEHPNVFSSQLGCLQGVAVDLNVNPSASPKFFKARPLPLALHKKVGEELDRLVEENIISPVKFSKWAAPIVPVVKKNGSIRVCGDFKLTVNQASPIDSYPLPRIEELFAKLSGGRYFSKLDLAQAYLQIPLNEPSKEYVTINTHRGLFRYNRLPFGVASAPSIFQRYIRLHMCLS